MDLIFVNLRKLPHKEYIEYMRGYLHIIEDKDPDVLHVEDQFNALTDKVDDIEAVYKQNRASDLTQVIADLDKTRDSYLVGIASVVNGYLEHYDESKVQSAQRLSTTIAVYGTPSYIAGESLQGQTTTLNNLIEDFEESATLAADLTALGLTDWVGQLKIVNENLRSAYWDRTTQKGAAPQEKIKDLRNEGLDLYYELRDFLMANALLAGYAAPYDEVINEINAHNEQYNQTLARRFGEGTTDPEDNGGDDDVGNGEEPQEGEDGDGNNHNE